MTSKRGRTLKVGVFAAGALVLSIIAVFLIGDNRRSWDSKRSFTARFKDVGGLRTGSPVRMGGIDVGQVTAVRHDEKNAGDPLIYVTIAVAKDEAVRVKPDTKAKVAGKGLLGDKMIILEGGDPRAEPAPDKSTIASDIDAKDFMARLDEISAKADMTMEAVKKTSESLADPQMADDLKGSVKALRVILEGVANNKDGAAHKFIFDPEEGKRVDRILANLETTSANAARASADAREIASRAKTGPGLVHTLVYDDQLAAGTTGTMVELHNSLKALRTGNGLGHAIVYGDDNTQHVMGNVNAMSDDLREIVANMKAGRGTIGALLVDPTVYEDIKSLVGNVERNQVLRALVRYSIKQSEEKPHATVTDNPHPTQTPSAQK
jgi:phospholipid/cholesterol/gamma-HCH transport system substrate-binding protein